MALSSRRSEEQPVEGEGEEEEEEEEERVPYQSIRNSRVEGHVLVAVPRSP